MCKDFPLGLVKSAAAMLLVEDGLECLVSVTDFLTAFKLRWVACSCWSFSPSLPPPPPPGPVLGVELIGLPPACCSFWKSLCGKSAALLSQPPPPQIKICPWRPVHPAIISGVVIGVGGVVVDVAAAVVVVGVVVVRRLIHAEFLDRTEAMFGSYQATASTPSSEGFLAQLGPLCHHGICTIPIVSSTRRFPNLAFPQRSQWITARPRAGTGRAARGGRDSAAYPPPPLPTTHTPPLRPRPHCPHARTDSPFPYFLQSLCARRSAGHAAGRDRPDQREI